MEKFYKKWFIPLSLPAIILFIGVILLPFVIGVFYSFTGWRGSYFAGGTSNPFESLVGLDNYVRAFNSERFINALIYTVKYTLVAVIWINAAGLILALLLQKIRRGSGLFRTVFFMPNLLGGLAMGYIWAFIFEIVFTQVLFSESGFISIPFLRNMTQDNTKAIFALVLLVSWQMAGYMMLIYTNGLNAIPIDLYEAGRIDGANAIQSFRYITLPMLMPSFTIAFFLTLANSFKLLDANVALTDGNFNTRMLALQILRTTRDTSPPDYGLAQAQAVIFFVMVAIISLTQVYFTKRMEVEA